ncbi:glycosyl hydrolase [Streptomyces viridochromogenes DSM 40736]|uniref:Glycosyl hydrolase n=1 Tax=Streptomyces viridochromogenes (strain DSM 40736 / JCM 4977 / BCRC 1201 / Tue 494) TaxID=591159 RepID=D9XAR4_STRVT|nr:glycoside hydrolase family 15 protein [Streptomyces viridochromogenes]EFL32226.1 glycosyl hydrolase [Streptomyces viridochromogenes DSM 40736]
MRRYPPIADHGLIGDLQTSALVTGEGVIDWFCPRRFDAPSLFASLLDHDRGGYFSVTAEAENPTPRQLYLADTAILVTRFLTEDGTGEVVDFMPVDEPETPTDRHEIVRLLRCVRGKVRFTMECRPRFDYARAGHRLELADGTARFEGPGTTAYLQTDKLPLERDGDDVTATVELGQGEIAAAVLTVRDSGAAAPEPIEETTGRRIFAETAHFWRGWLRQCRYQGRWQNAVKRSAITLKLLTYAPTGAYVAAATMGLPEQIGGERNWDYRYTWIRDASFTVRALVDLGFNQEAAAFAGWLDGRLRSAGTVTGEPLQIMYRLDGDPRLDEEILDHLEGYRGSAPIRLGNGAAGQLQLDIYGEAVYALAVSREVTEGAGYDGWKVTAGVLDWLAKHWDRPDEGIWETRGGRKDFTYSRVMSWAAFHHGIRLADSLAAPADVMSWRNARDAIMAQVMEHGWNEKRRALVQSYGAEVLDASLLLAPQVRFLSPKDPRWLATLDAMDEELVSDSLVYRYNPEASPDGLRGSEGTFSLCSFLYVSALARAGRLEQARYAFDKMLTYANHVGLFAEEIGPSGEQLGNFPQAFTHLSLITAAIALDDELDRAELG